MAKVGNSGAAASRAGKSANSDTKKHNHQALIEFVRGLPVGPAYAPIYASGIRFGKHESVSHGKAPHEASHHRKFGPEDVALLLEQKPETFQAVGLFTGIRSDGIVILDVDANLQALTAKWGNSIAGAPQVRSTKPNAAKFVFRVPVEQRSVVKGLTLSQSKCGYEILWGMQGIIAGAYPGSSDGKSGAGAYRLVSGSFDAIPDAPEWLLAEMRARKSADAPVQGLVRNRRGLDFSGRTQDEVAEIVHDCLQVLPHLGRGSEDQWWAIGAMVAEALPTEMGLALWTAWSAQDPAFEDDWADGNPCEEKWPRLMERVGKPGNLGLGSLVKLADEYDPERLRFQDSSRRTIEEVEASQAQKTRTVYRSYSELLEEARTIQKLENPAEQNHRMHVLALEAGYRDASALERLLIADSEYRINGEQVSGESIYTDTKDLDYLIPDLLPTPSTVMLHGEGGNGKSAFAATLARHVLRAAPMSIRGQMFPVNKGKPGKVLWLNGDQSKQQLKATLKDADITIEDLAGFVPIQGWELQWYGRFTRLIEKHVPDLVIIDSVTGCSKGSAFTENQKEFASPLYWLALNNGSSFPPCAILLLHHSNKTGGYRGTSSLKDATDETRGIAFSKTSAENRIVTVEKSRAGRKGRQILLQLTSDMDFIMKDVEPEQDDSPASHEARLLARLHAAGGRWVPRTELAADPVVGGSVKALRKRLERLVAHQLVEQRVVEERKGSPRYEFRIPFHGSLSPVRCVGEKNATLEEPSQGLEGEGGPVSITPPSNNFQKRRFGKKVEGGRIKNAPPSELSGGAGSSRVAEIFGTHKEETAAEGRSAVELERLRGAAFELWD
jgi:hypothetical protein